MVEIPDTTNFYSSLITDTPRGRIATLFQVQGWIVREPDDWDYVEVRCPWAELVIESESPILMHGPIADVEVNVERVFQILAIAKVAYSAEIYGPQGNLIRQYDRSFT